MEVTVRQYHDPNLCMGLSRFFGGIGFLIVSIMVFKWLNQAWDLGVTDIAVMKDLGTKGYVAMFLSIGAGIIGLFIGQGIGASIKVKSDNTASTLTIAWHYLANVSIYWMLASTIAAGIMLGQSGEVFFRQHGTAFFISGLIISAVGSQIICAAFNVGGRMLQIGNPSGNLIIIFVPLVVGVGMAILHFGLFDISPWIGIFFGFLMPFIVIPITASMWRKDMASRYLDSGY